MTDMAETAFSNVPLFNQHVWDTCPDKAANCALDAIMAGGFDEDCIRRRVGNYEGQIMAIRNGWAVKDAYKWRVTEIGLKALKEAGRAVPQFLPAWDSWHNKPYTICAYEETAQDGSRYLNLFKEAHASGADWGMKPVLTLPDVIALRDYLNSWLAKQ